MFDAFFGDEYLRPHPVAIYGHAMRALERRIRQDKRLAGVTYLVGGMAAPALSGAVMDRLPGGALAAGFTTVSGQGLWQAASQVADALEAGDLEAARRCLPRLVGRDVRRLDAGGIARAVIESVAENTSDGIVAPALYAAVGGAAGRSPIEPSIPSTRWWATATPATGASGGRVPGPTMPPTSSQRG